MTHTPTPWFESPDGPGGNGISAREADAETIVVSGFDDGYPQDPFIRARIVACVNFFHGRDIPTERIAESGFWEMVRLLKESRAVSQGINDAIPGSEAARRHTQKISDLLAKLGVEP